MDVALVERMLELHKKLYQRRMDATDTQIDALAYDLVGLKEEDVATVAERG